MKLFIILNVAVFTFVVIAAIYALFQAALAQVSLEAREPMPEVLPLKKGKKHEKEEEEELEEYVPYVPAVLPALQSATLPDFLGYNPLGSSFPVYDDAADPLGVGDLRRVEEEYEP